MRPLAMCYPRFDRKRGLPILTEKIASYWALGLWHFARFCCLDELTRARPKAPSTRPLRC